MSRDRAAYMRDYRTKKRRAAETQEKVQTRAEEDQYDFRFDDYRRRIADLEAEVARLKRELAARPALTGHVFNSRPFRPVPKPGKH